MARASWGNGSKLWRERAVEIRTLAERMQDQLTRDIMLRLPDDYERLAREAEERIPYDC
jgi:hypothetical protein